jgi:pimeloyl-ACP methyl ester carboxylesterase
MNGIAHLRWQSVGSLGVRGRILALGHGPNAILLASPLARGESYLATARSLAKHFRAHLLEMPGSGIGTRLTSAWFASDYAAWVADTIAARRLAGSVVIGHSYSGMVAIALAAERPDLVGALVAADSSGTGPPMSLWKRTGGAVLDSSLDLGVVATKWPHVVSNAVRHFRNFSALVREAVGADVSAQARKVSAPTLIAWGGRSRFMPPTAARALADCLNESQVYVSPRGAHTWVVSQPDEFARAVATFYAARMPKSLGKRSGVVRE